MTVVLSYVHLLSSQLCCVLVTVTSCSLEFPLSCCLSIHWSFVDRYIYIQGPLFPRSLGYLLMSLPTAGRYLPIPLPNIHHSIVYPPCIEYATLYTSQHYTDCCALYTLPTVHIFFSLGANCIGMRPHFQCPPRPELHQTEEKGALRTCHLWTLCGGYFLCTSKDWSHRTILESARCHQS